MASLLRAVLTEFSVTVELETSDTSWTSLALVVAIDDVYIAQCNDQKSLLVNGQQDVERSEIGGLV
jgi:hypothetical protein